MITIEQLQSKIDDITGLDTRSKNRREYFRQVMRYLKDASPTHEYIMSELRLTDVKLERMLALRPEWAKLPGMEAKKKAWEAEHDIPKLRLHLKTLRFLLI